MKRGEVDIERSLFWNVLNYRRSDQDREWSTLHSAMWRRIMVVHTIIFLVAPILAGAVLIVALPYLLGWGVTR